MLWLREPMQGPKWARCVAADPRHAASPCSNEAREPGSPAAARARVPARDTRPPALLWHSPLVGPKWVTQSRSPWARLCAPACRRMIPLAPMAIAFCLNSLQPLADG
ncbi:hypothetical protein M758_12G005700 [Ceratodon purpureus]|nr:hypothetical protein M758_12G005700 [Ceratodon purpureus]